MRLKTESFVWCENNKVIEQSLKNQTTLDKTVKVIQELMIKSHVEQDSYCADNATKMIEEAKLNTLRYIVNQVPELRQHLIDSGEHFSNLMMENKPQ